jgi:hypothetical protein
VLAKASSKKVTQVCSNALLASCYTKPFHSIDKRKIKLSQAGIICTPLSLSEHEQETEQFHETHRGTSVHQGIQGRSGITKRASINNPSAKWL